MTALLRAAVLALLAAALLAPDRPPAPASAPRVVRFPERGWDPADFDSVLAGTAPALLVRASDEPPGAAELDWLAAAAERSPLLVRLPGEVTTLEARAPQRPVAGRAAAISFRLRVPSRDSVLVRLRDGAGVLDSVRVLPGADGAAEGAFRVRPPREGWREWSVEAGRAVARTGAWVAPGSPPRVLVVAGAPSWEARFVVRALEESGAAVETVQPLGRGLAVRQGGGGLPAGAAALARFDAVLVLDGAEVSAGQGAALAEYASRLGGGVLVAGAGGAGALRVGAAGGDAGVAGDRVRWRLPAELAPLPSAAVRSSAAPLRALVPGAVAGASSAEGTLLALRAAGRGRAAALALEESWRWRMEAGRVAEHREFWRSLVDWLASAPRGGAAVELPRAGGATGVPVEVRVFPGSGEAPASLSLVRPGGARERLPLRPDPARPGTLRAVFVPAAPGVHALGVGDGAPAAGFAAEREGGAAQPWARLALLAARSGGGALPADAFRAEMSRREGALPRGGGPRIPLRHMLLAAAAVLAVVEWTVRRLRGRA